MPPDLLQSRLDAGYAADAHVVERSMSPSMPPKFLGQSSRTNKKDNRKGRSWPSYLKYPTACRPLHFNVQPDRSKPQASLRYAPLGHDLRSDAMHSAWQDIQNININ